MYTFIIITLFAFFKSIADIIKVPATFNNSYFVRFSGTVWIDPIMTGKEPRNLIKKMFRDLWHTCNTINISLLLILPLAYVYSNSTWPYWLYFIAWWLVYGATFEFFYRTWKWFK